MGIALSSGGLRPEGAHRPPAAFRRRDRDTPVAASMRGLFLAPLSWGVHPGLSRPLLPAAMAQPGCPPGQARGPVCTSILSSAELP